MDYVYLVQMEIALTSANSQKKEPRVLIEWNLLPAKRRVQLKMKKEKIPRWLREKERKEDIQSDLLTDTNGAGKVEWLWFGSTNQITSRHRREKNRETLTRPGDGNHQASQLHCRGKGQCRAMLDGRRHTINHGVQQTGEQVDGTRMTCLLEEGSVGQS